MKTYSYTLTNPRDQINKDRFIIKDKWFAVCDGVSSKGLAGAEAAHIAITAVKDTNVSSLKDKRAVKNFLDKISKNIALIGGATTFTSVFLKENKGILIHTGDSECHLLFKDNSIKEITIPFIVPYGLYLNKQIKKEEIKTHQHSNVLTDCLAEKPFESQILQFSLDDIKTIFLCTDGVKISPQEITTLILNSKNPAKSIAYAAQKAGSRDDITTIVVNL